MNTVAVIVNSPELIVPEYISVFFDILKRNEYSVHAPSSCKPILSQYSPYIDFLPDDTYLDGCRIAFVIGGDGSIIEAARQTVGRDIPLAGINYGHLGYMTAIEKNDPVQFQKLLQGTYEVEERAMLDIAVIRDGQRIPMPYPALNDLVISNGNITKMMSFDLYCNGIKTQTYRADGLILSTATGSTAYSLACGGPVVSPLLDCIIATPLAPHALTSRPVIFNNDTTIEIKNIHCRLNRIYALVDGRDTMELFGSDTVIIKDSPLKTKLIRMTGDDFLLTLYRKMSE